MSETGKSDSGLQRLPEGCECRLDFYLTSDATGLEAVIGLSGMTALPAMVETGKALGLAKSLGVAVGPMEEAADDWRLMSRTEIADYKRRQEEEERGGAFTSADAEDEL